MSSAIRDHIRLILREARALADGTLIQPKSEREYMIASGRYRQMLAEARRLEERFLRHEESEPQADLPEEPADDPAPRRASPPRDRLDQVRARHRPRQM